MTLPKSTREGRCQFHKWVPNDENPDEEFCSVCQRTRPRRERPVSALERQRRERPKLAADMRKSSLKRGRGFAASPAQREKAREEPCVVTGEETLYGATIDPMHLWPRSRGGCDDPLCTVPGRRDIHDLFDEGKFDLLPYLVKRRLPELHHALDHANGDLCALLHRLTGKRPYVDERRAA